MPGVERIAANAGEILRRGVVLPEAPSGGSVPEGEERGTVDRCQEPGVGPDPAQILDPESGGGGRRGGSVEVEPEDDLAGAEVPDGDATLAVPNREAEVGGGGVVVGGEVAEKGLRRPADGGDKGG